jgi:hypothetical protein
VLIVLPAADRPSRSSVDRCRHEFGLKNELDAAWAARPLDLVRDDNQVVFVLEDRGGEPLDNQQMSTLEAHAGRILLGWAVVLL